MKAVFWLVIMAFNANIPFTFQAIKHPSAHPTYLCFWPFFIILLVILRYIWRYIAFLEGLVKFMEIGILKIWCCFKITI